MSVTVYFANVSKRRNSTLQGTFSTSYDCTLKAPTSLDRPTFLVSAETMDYNAAKLGNRYYFIDDVVSVRQGQWEVSCVLDVLATYKSDILASTQFVAYSSYKSSDWLSDSRMPVLKSETVEKTYKSSALTPINVKGFYALTATGQDGTCVYAMEKEDVDSLIANLNTWANDYIVGINTGSGMGYTYDFSTVQAAIESYAYMASQTGFLGNAYANAPSNIRSCMWLPLSKATFASGSKRLYLGSFDTGLDLPVVSVTPVDDHIDIDIPWQHSDWRRSVCESLTLYLPFAGCINIPTDLVCSESALHVRYSISPTDGVISYLVYAGDFNIIGTYGGNLGADYAIGINQKASMGEIAQTAFAGAEKTVASLINTSLNPVSTAAGFTGAALAGVSAIYNTANVAMSTHPTTIGSFGGCAAAFLTYGGIYLVSVAHNTVAAPSTMLSTMGYPTMQTLSLSDLTGYCQCVNAHVAAAAQAQELDAIDTYLNSGFFIE